MDNADISVVILTKNEEAEIGRCIESLRWVRDIHIVDSFSQDNTCGIAEGLGAKIYRNKFGGFGAQRNWALSHCRMEASWVLFLDADEESTEEFAAAVTKTIVHASDDIGGYYCCWKTILDGRWLRWSDSYPKWQMRIVRRGRADFINVGHGQKEGTVFGRLAYIHKPYLHYAFSKGWHHWFEKHNCYSDQEAIERLDHSPSIAGILSNRHSSIRNVAIKRLVSRIPFWPLLRFVHGYFLRGGLLDGRPGFVYSVLMGYYEFMIQLKMRELRDARGRGKT